MCQMKFLVFVVLLLNVALATSPRVVPFEVQPVSRNSTGLQFRIYGGVPADEGQFPFMIFTQMKTTRGVLKCSSCLISPEWVLLAAHCLSFPNLQPKNILSVGERADLMRYVVNRVLRVPYDEPIDEAKFGVQERRAQDFFQHPGFVAKTLDHDVGLVRLREPFVLGPKVRLIPLSENRIRTPKLCTILGWGITNWGDPQRLYYYEKKEVSTPQLGCVYKTSGAFLCLEPGGSGMCMGDSGSPLVCDGKVWGVASHYVTTREYSACGDSIEEYYTELYGDLEWVKSVYGGGSSTASISLNAVLLCLLTSLWLSAKK